ncbi:hypothetical protein AC1031_008797 [Aphanomyces cochlioides]|nr:hypothetical protein AC1031_008797 [Aphanomyces cochlioides]
MPRKTSRSPTFSHAPLNTIEAEKSHGTRNLASATPVATRVATPAVTTATAPATTLGTTQATNSGGLDAKIFGATATTFQHLAVFALAVKSVRTLKAIVLAVACIWVVVLLLLVVWMCRRKKQYPETNLDLVEYTEVFPWLFTSRKAPPGRLHQTSVQRNNSIVSLVGLSTSRLLASLPRHADNYHSTRETEETHLRSFARKIVMYPKRLNRRRRLRLQCDTDKCNFNASTLTMPNMNERRELTMMLNLRVVALLLLVLASGSNGYGRRLFRSEEIETLSPAPRASGALNLSPTTTVAPVESPKPEPAPSTPAPLPSLQTPSPAVNVTTSSPLPVVSAPPQPTMTATVTQLPNTSLPPTLSSAIVLVFNLTNASATMVVTSNPSIQATVPMHDATSTAVPQARQSQTISAPQIAGIALGCFAVGLLVAYLVYFLCTRRLKDRECGDTDVSPWIDSPWDTLVTRTKHSNREVSVSYAGLSTARLLQTIGTAQQSEHSSRGSVGIDSTRYGDLVRAVSMINLSGSNILREGSHPDCHI